MKHPVLSAIILAGLILGTALGLSYLQSAGLIAPDLADRGTMAAIGLVVAIYGNFMPKQLERPRGDVRAEAVAQSILRVGGWAMMLGGVAWAAIWMLAPMAVANPLAIAAMVSAMAVTLGNAIWTFRRHKRPDNG